MCQVHARKHKKKHYTRLCFLDVKEPHSRSGNEKRIIKKLGFNCDIPTEDQKILWDLWIY